MALNPAILVNGVRELFTLPDLYYRVSEMVSDPDASLSDMAEVIALDVGLSARMLKIVNSAFFGFPSSIETVSHAVNILGTDQVHDIVLSASVAGRFSGIDTELMDLPRYWRTSVYSAVSARLLANRCNVLDGERLFVEGLLADIGHLVMYQTIPDQARQALQEATARHEPLYRVEQELLGFDYAQVGGELARVWELPTSLRETIGQHTAPSQAMQFPLETAIVHIALALSAEESATGGGLEQVLPEAWLTTHLAEEDMAAVKREIPGHMKEALSLILPDPVAA